jgi:Ca2+-binding RTX toxin-like protein
LGTVTRSGSVVGNLSFDTTLIPGTPDAGPFPINDANLADGYGFTLPDLGDLADFSLISPAAIIAGIGQAAAGIGGAQSIGDVDLPFITGTVRRIAQASRPILDVVDALGVICGTEGAGNASPSGSVEDLTIGQKVYCRSVVTSGVQAGSVTWTSPNASEDANVSGAGADRTVGLTPSKNAEFTVTTDGDFVVDVSYTATFDDDNDAATPPRTESRTSTQPPMSVQALAERLVALGPFDASAADLFDYAPATHALTADLAMSVDPAAVELQINVGSQLESATGVAGLQTTSGSVTANAGNVSIDLTAGVFLLPPDDWDTVASADGSCPDPSIVNLADCDDALNLFFVEVDPTAAEFRIDDAAFSVNSPTLSGQLGYLEVTASAPTFALGRADNTQPVIRVDLVPQAGNMTVGGVDVPNAIPLRELLFDITDRTDVSPLNLKFDADFDITAALNGTPIGTAGVGVTWDPVLVGAPTITPDLNFDSLFQNFNPVPNLFGQATNGSPSATVLEASGANFTSSSVGSRVVNMTDGSSCEVASQTATTLTCSDPLGGVENTTWDSGDLYRVEIGSPLAMLELLLDNLDQIVAAIDNVSGAGLGEALDTELPIVGISPRALLGQIQDIRQTIDEIRQPAADVLCGLEHAAGTVSGDPSELVLDGAGHATIYCTATHNKPATDVVWSVSGATATVTPPADPATTVGAAPSDVVTIVFNGAAGATLPERSSGTAGYQVDLSFSDNDGSHDAEYPSESQPTSIQKLEDVIKEKLGLGDGFGLSIDDVNGDSVVVLDLQVGRCNDDALCDTTSGDDANMPPLISSINADVDGLGGLVSASSDGDVGVKYNANARLKLAFALSLTTPQVYVMPDTGITLAGQFFADDLNFEAAFGPFAVVAGTDVVDDNGTPADGSDDRGGLGTVKLGAQLSVGGAITTPVAIGTFLGALGTYLAPTFGSLPDEDCGSIVTDTPNPGDQATLQGLGCAAISLGLKAGSAVNYVADLGLTVDLVGGEFVITPYVPADLLAQFAAAALDFELLLKALPEIIGSVEQALRSSAADAAGNNKIPLIGDALDAGADVAGALRDVAQTVVDNIPPEVYDATDVAGLKTVLQGFIYNSLQPSGLLRTADGTAVADDPTDIVIIATCAGSDCADGDSPFDIDDLRVIFGVGQEADTELPFDLGMDGVPLRLAGSLAPHVIWNYVVDLGLSRTEGPYIGVSDPGGNVRPDTELSLTAGIGLGAKADQCPGLVGSPIASGSWSSTNCLGGQVAFLGINVADNDDNPTSLDLTVGLDLTNGAEDTLSFGNAGDVSLDPSLTVEANVDLAFRTGIVGTQAAGFPSVVGHFGLGWGFGFGNNADNHELEVTFDQLFLDVGPLIEKFLDPILKEVRRFTGPFQPIIDTLTAPIPVVSDLAEMVGQPPVTLLGLMELISGNDLSLIQSIAAFITFVNNAPTGGGYFSLSGDSSGGGFSVDSSAGREAQGPTSAAALVQAANVSAASLLSQTPTGGTSDISSKAAQTTAPTKANLPGTFGVPGLTFPFLDNPSQIFGLLMGQDITLVRYDFGPLEASAGFSYNFPPIMVGPVPIAIGVGGSVTVRGRFAVGYDTSGLRKVLSGGSGIYLFDGIFIDDLDASGVDVPEISFIGEVYAQAGVTVVIATAGIVAGLRITIDLNLNDSPEPDGKLRIEEIFNKLQNPICLFDVSGKLEAFIKAFVELNLFITSVRFDFTILEIELLNFSASCTPPKPVLAQNDNGTLRLNIGDRADQRNVSEEVTDEEFTVRPINAIGGYSVSAFGVYQTFGPGGEFGGPAITAVVGNAIGGDDTLKMLPGGDQQKAPEPGTGAPENTSIPFSIGVTLNGGDDNDVIQGGDGVDNLSGGSGNDRLEGAKGGDTLNGGADNDTLNGDEGNDFLYGNEGADQLQGGPGDDYGEGGAGADLLQGGPGTDVAGGTDGNDTLIGNGDQDTIEGGTGDDHVYGEEQIADPALCANDTVDPGGDPNAAADKLSGGDGDDVLFGGHGPDEMFGGSGNDLLCGNQGADSIDGDQSANTTETDANPDPQVNTSGGNDTVYGGNGRDSVAGNFGHDFVKGNAGGDVVSGGPGNDDVSGGLGGDLLNGDLGVDLIVGDDALIAQGSSKAGRTTAAALEALNIVSGIGTGVGGVPGCSTGGADGDLADCIRGGAGNDLVFGEGGNDDINGGTEDDIVHAGTGADNPVRGDSGADVMFGDADNDTMYGDSGTDRMFGNAGSDVMSGLNDDDYMEGNQDSDTMYGDAGQDDLIGGTSTTATPDAGDFIFGGAAPDVIVGDNGEITRPGGNESDDATTLDRDITIHDVGSNAVGGGDTIVGGTANDRIFGGNADDLVFGESGRDLIEGNDGNDLVRGGDDNDRIAGGSSDRAVLKNAALASVAYDASPDRATSGPTHGDVLFGDGGDDVIAGDDALVRIDGTVAMTSRADANVFGADIVRGNDGQDRLYGQLGGDNIQGDANEDYLVGDLGFVTPGAPNGVWPGGAPKYDVSLALAPDLVGTGDPAAGADTLFGNDADDHLFGGVGNDTVEGDAGDDYMEGNGGQDRMFGFALNGTALGTDQDDMIGGTSAWTRPGSVVRLDEGEQLMQGNSDRDVMTGDNATIDRIDSGGAWAADEVIAGARKRVVTLLDREKTGVDLDAVGGDDWMQGNDGSDRMFGEGGSDLAQGNAADDLIEGNQDPDWLEGNDGEDDIVGGSSFLASAGGAMLPGSGADLGDPDAGDVIYGGSGADVLAGDNAIVVRKTTGNSAAYSAALGSAYFTSDHLDAVPGWWLGVNTDRLVRLLDRTTVNTGRFGADLISAGSGDDVAFGQDGDDWLTGGANDDAIEGNGGADRLYGDRSTATAADVPGVPASLVQWVVGNNVSIGVARDGLATPDGEDDIVGGSNLDHRDGNDSVEGDGEDDFVLGDNGTLRRQISGAELYVAALGDGPTNDRVFRQATRLGLGSGAGLFGNDVLFGNAGDDAIWGQNGNDQIRGQQDDDDLLGELGDDVIWGGSGEDAIVGDRGSILNTQLGAAGAQFSQAQTSASYNGPPFFSVPVQYFTTGRYDRRIDLNVERPGSVGGPFPGQSNIVMTAGGQASGGSDTLRGGPDHDSMHGAAGDDIMNGDSGGDYMFGDDGSDVMWGGRGNDDGSADQGTNRVLIDRLFGGRGGNPAVGAGIITGGADVLDYKPRTTGPNADPVAWFLATQPYDDGAAGGSVVTQTHQGTDWIYGGFDRDVMEANVASPGPNDGDRLWDWTGAYNLYVHCTPDYGGYNDQRTPSPQMEGFLETLAYDSGVGTTIADVLNASSSAYNELAFVYKPDVKNNNGQAYPTTPGHFDAPTACDNN